MQKRFFTVGPSQLYPTVRGHMEKAFENDIPSLSHRSADFSAIHRTATRNLKELMGVPEDYRIFFLSSATEAMERTIQNCVEHSSFHHVNGSFSGKFHQTALGLKKDALKQVSETREALSASVPEQCELVAYTQNETATGIAVPPDVIGATHARHPDKLIAVDIVSSAPSVPLDFSSVDLAFFSVQKGFGLPAGLGALMVSPRAFERGLALAAKGVNVSWYHSFAELEAYRVKDQTHETPNVLNIYLLAAVSGDMLQEGIRAIREKTEQRADQLYSVMLGNERFSSTVPDPALRSRTTASFAISGGSAPLIAFLKERGIVVGAGYGKQKESHVRIGNFPAHSDADFEALFDALGQYR